MNSTKSRRGRKPKPYVCPWNNQTVDGLYRCPDGRWRITATGQKFTEPDERLAVAYFERLTNPRPPVLLAAPLAVVAPELRLPDEVQIDPGALQKARYLAALATDDSAACVNAKANQPPADWEVTLDVPEALLWAWFRHQLITRPQYVSERVGIEQIAYLPDLKPPVPLPKFSDLEGLWKRHCTASDEQRRKVLHDWKDFVATTGIKTLKEITAEVCIAYRDTVYSRNYQPIAQRNLFTRIRRMISFAKKRAVAIEACNQALQYLALLVPSDTVVSLNPKPITRDEFERLLAKAEGENRAMILLMMNCGMYLQEVVRIRWDEIKDGCIVSHRKKSGLCVRVAKLWPETITALSGVKRRGKEIFYSYNGTPLGVKGAEARFRDLRDKAKLPHVTGSQLRDGAYTAAVEAGVSENLCRLLMGHRCGMPDHYVKRKPSMVAPACDAIRTAYLG